MEFDIRTQESAYNFVLEFLDISEEDFIMEYKVTCDGNIYDFIDLHYDDIERKDISNFKIMAFHVLGSLDGCEEIKSHGLMNLQEVLSQDTILRRALLKVGLVFDIDNRKLFYGTKEYDIDYDKYKNEWFLNPVEEKLCNIGHRVYYDFCVNGFLFNDDVEEYGTDIHERPEFFICLTEMFPAIKKIERLWKSKSESYRVNFFATIDQINTFTYEVDLDSISEFDMQFFDLHMEIKKWMLSLACSIY